MKLLAIDGNSILNRAFYGVRLLANKKGVYTNAVFGFLNILISMLNETNPDCVAVAFDVSRKTFRNDMFTDYKGTRKGMPEELAPQLPIIKEILVALGYKIIGIEGFEADDILGTLAKMCCKNNDECIIATGDRDSLQLVSKNVNVRLATNKQPVLYDIDKIKLDYNLTPIQLIDVKALMGDSSDNIPGVKGIGEKTALDLIQRFDNVENIIENLESLDIKPRVKELIENNKDMAILSKKLGTIKLDVDINLKLQDLFPTTKDELKLKEILSELEMFSFFSKLGLKNTSSNENSQKKQFNININSDLQTLTQKLNNAKQIAFLIKDFEEHTKLYINIENDIYTFQNDYLEVFKHICNNSKVKKYVFDAKKYYKLAFENGLLLENVSFDVLLGAYVLDTNTKTYTLENLCQRYLEDVFYDVESEYLDITCIIDLSLKIDNLLKQQKSQKLYYDIELPLSEVLASMEYEGFGIDLDGLNNFGKMLTEQIEDIKQKILKLAGEDFNPNSTKELGVILFEKLELPAKKKTKTGYSTNAEVLEDLKELHPIIPLLIEYRKLTKLNSTYVIGLEKVVCKDGRIRSTFNQTETRTGRISSLEPNVQNIPIRTELGSQMRKFFIARDGYVLLDADYSQIELRILAHMSQDKNMIDGFNQGIDIHKITASQVFGEPIDHVSDTFRNRAKAINFGIVYGIGAFSLAKDIGVAVYEAKEYIENYLETYSGVDKYLHDVIDNAKKDGFVTTMFGRRRDVLEINSTKKMVAAFSERVAMNAPIQGTAADIIKIAMVKVYEKLKQTGLDAKLILQVHDELIVEVAQMQSDFAKKILQQEMEDAAKLLVPLVVDISQGKNWYNAKG